MAGENETSCGTRVDRISDLPCDVIDHILQFLPLKDAVKTSILSTHWRYNWTMLSQLILDHQFFSAILKFNCPYENGESYLCKCKISQGKFVVLSELVNKMLLRHSGAIRKFSLHIPHWFPEGVDISHWVQFVSGKFVEEFTLSQEKEAINGYQQPRKLPTSMFAPVGFDHLTHLTLNGFRSLPDNIRGFPCLISLLVRRLPSGPCTAEVNKVGMLVSKCPQLESLHFLMHEPESCLTLRAPNLQNLVLNGNLSSICLEETKKIKTLILGAYLGHMERGMKDLFSWLPRVETLVLGDRFVDRWLTKVGLPEKLKPPGELRQLKHLKIVGVQPDSRFVSSFIPFILCLFQKASMLQELEIGVHDTIYRGNMTVAEDWRLDQLKNAKVSCTVCSLGNSIVLRLVELILSSSPVLEVMTLYANVHSREELNIEKEVLQYHRASPNAEIIFKPWLMRIY